MNEEEPMSPVNYSKSLTEIIIWIKVFLSCKFHQGIRKLITFRTDEEMLKYRNLVLCKFYLLIYLFCFGGS